MFPPLNNPPDFSLTGVRERVQFRSESAIAAGLPLQREFQQARELVGHRETNSRT